MVVAAGYDRLSRVIPIAHGNYVFTGGLMNCIAVALYSVARQRMAMAHFQTLQCFDSDENCFSLATLTRWREKLTDATTLDTFEVGLGTSWEIRSSTAHSTIAMRADLINKITLAFGLNRDPVIAGKCLRFGCPIWYSDCIVVMEGTESENWMTVPESTWRDEGTAIDYPTWRR